LKTEFIKTSYSIQYCFNAFYLQGGPKKVTTTKLSKMRINRIKACE